MTICGFRIDIFENLQDKEVIQLKMAAQLNYYLINTRKFYLNYSRSKTNQDNHF